VALLDARPHYRVIEQELRSRIARLEAGARLPSEAELCREFAVSRMTVRHAMQRLTEDGIVARQPGRGSFVAMPPAHRRADRLMTFSHEMRRRGRQPHSRLLERAVRPASAAEARDLRQAPGTLVVVLRRIRYADDDPIALETTILDQRCGPAVLAADLERGSLHETMARAGHALRRGRGTILAATATAEEARLLGLRPGAPLLVGRRVIGNRHGEPLEATESRYAAERYALDVRFDVDPPPADT
jgi:GntR family transcriptional regulator